MGRSEVDPAPVLSSVSRRQAVNGLLLDLFNEDELRRWLGYYDVLEPLRRELPTKVSLSQLVDDLVGAAERRGLLAPPFFDALEHERAGRADDIALW